LEKFLGFEKEAAMIGKCSVCEDEDVTLRDGVCNRCRVKDKKAKHREKVKKEKEKKDHG
jgi:hypothetical protein